MQTCFDENKDLSIKIERNVVFLSKHIVFQSQIYELHKVMYVHIHIEHKYHKNKLARRESV